ncbi:MAG: isochorismatase family cysteine hydrolase [Chloroflexota bacterium]
MKALLTSIEDKARLEHTALIVVDIQNDFLHPEGFMAKHTPAWKPVDNMVERLECLIAGAREYGVFILFARNWFSNLTLSPVIRERWQRIWPGLDVRMCWENDWGADFYRVKPLPSEPVIIKHRYSAFLNTDLDMVLHNHSIKTLVITGYTTNACVETTARDAYMHDYYVVVAGDCCACQNPVLHEATLRSIETGYGVVTSSDKLLAIWSRSKHPAVPRPPADKHG